MKKFFLVLTSSTKTKRSVPDTLYPEILVIIDHSLYKLFQKNIYKMVSYLLAFWNGVDMKYRSLMNPKYRLNIAGIILANVRFFRYFSFLKQL